MIDTLIFVSYFNLISNTTHCEQTIITYSNSHIEFYNESIGYRKHQVIHISDRKNLYITSDSAALIVNPNNSVNYGYWNEQLEFYKHDNNCNVE